MTLVIRIDDVEFVVAVGVEVETVEGVRAVLSELRFVLRKLMPPASPEMKVICTSKAKLWKLLFWYSPQWSDEECNTGTHRC